MPDVTLQRRDVLRLAGVAVAAGALAACTTSGDSTRPTSVSPGAPDDPDRALRDAVADDELRLAAAYAAVTGLPTELQARVTALGSRHPVYAAAVRPLAPSGSGSAGSATPTGAGSSTSAAGSPTPDATTSPASGTPKPADQINGAEAALRRLRELERKAAADRAAQSVRASDPELARTIVLAGTGAAGAATVLARLKVAR